MNLMGGLAVITVGQTFNDLSYMLGYLLGPNGPSLAPQHADEVRSLDQKFSVLHAQWKGLQKEIDKLEEQEEESNG